MEVEREREGHPGSRGERGLQGCLWVLPEGNVKKEMSVCACYLLSLTSYSTAERNSNV